MITDHFVKCNGYCGLRPPASLSLQYISVVLQQTVLGWDIKED